MVSKPQSVSGNSLELGLQAEHQPSRDRPFPSPTSQNSSILSLTLDEIQFKSGKSVGSMNMDEFLASIWSVEENQPGLPGQNDPVTGPPIQLSALQRQGSFSIPTSLCNKTVDEVWFEIHREQQNQMMMQSSPAGLGNANHGPPRRQQTFGEMTLEDFLVKAGIVQEPNERNLISSIFQKLPGNSSGTGYGTGYAFGNTHSAAAGSNGFSNGYPAYPKCSGSGGEPSCNPLNEKYHHGFNEAAGFKNRRIIDGPSEVVVERRQRRMIKNRESAARSRARKQAYTVELEVELNQLREENERLKKIMAELEQKRKQEVMKRKQITKVGKAAEKIRAIRRAVSMTW